MDRRTVLAAAAACALGGCDARRSAGPSLPLQATLRDLDGNTASLSQWQGRVLVLNVWASWCAPCRAEMASLQALADRVDPAQAAVIGLSVDEDQNLMREYLRRTDVRFRNFVAGSARAAQDLFGVRALPETLILAPDTTLRARVQGARDWTEASLLAPLGIVLLPVSSAREAT